MKRRTRDWHRVAIGRGFGGGRAGTDPGGTAEKASLLAEETAKSSLSLAPTVQYLSHRIYAATPPWTQALQRIIRWRHKGVGLNDGSVYSSTRVPCSLLPMTWSHSRRIAGGSLSDPDVGSRRPDAVCC